MVVKFTRWSPWTPITRPSWSKMTWRWTTWPKGWRTSWSQSPGGPRGPKGGGPRGRNGPSKGGHVVVVASYEVEVHVAYQDFPSKVGAPLPLPDKIPFFFSPVIKKYIKDSHRNTLRPVVLIQPYMHILLYNTNKELLHGQTFLSSNPLAQSGV